MSVRTLLGAYLAGMLAIGGASAEVVASGAWIPVPPPGAKVLAGFLELVNPGPDAARLTGVASPLARKIELHAMEMADGLARMRRRDVLEIPAGGRVTLAPGSLHLMIYLAAQAPAAGTQVPLELSFEDGTRLAVDAVVRARDEAAAADDPHSRH